MDSNSLPMVPELGVFPEPIRYVVLALLVLGPLVLGALVLAGVGSTPTVVVEATVVDSPPSDAEVHALSTVPDDSPVRTAVGEALRTGSGSVEATTEEVRADGFSATEYYVRHDGRVVRVSLQS
ncbi:hypothetical protein [Salinigranum sp. GCM10025319]|uniref:hypothetical protein n=1 Tax=Salinigranum sp. GCM10025319 TaxID=3252687 RepID=UPI00361ADAE6